MFGYVISKINEDKADDDYALSKLQYEQGVQNYNKRDYQKAIEFFTQSLSHRNKYAEANVSAFRATSIYYSQQSEAKYYLTAIEDYTLALTYYCKARDVTKKMVERTRYEAGIKKFRSNLKNILSTIETLASNTDYDLKYFSKQVLYNAMRVLDPVNELLFVEKILDQKDSFLSQRFHEEDSFFEEVMINKIIVRRDILRKHLGLLSKEEEKNDSWWPRSFSLPKNSSSEEKKAEKNMSSESSSEFSDSEGGEELHSIQHRM